jgi:hypothetical protein
MAAHSMREGRAAAFHAANPVILGRFQVLAAVYRACYTGPCEDGQEPHVLPSLWQGLRDRAEPFGH